MLRFSIRGWRAVSGRMGQEADWRAWAMGMAAEDFPPRSPTLDFLAPMQRRRLSASARMMVEAAWPLLGEQEHMPMVYVSHDGEINRSVALWLGLLRDGEVSPTSFALSVHNALVGQWSMLRGDTSENTALSARSALLETGVVEGCGLLADGHPAVLVVVVDEPLLPEYAAPRVPRAPWPYALAMVLVPGQDWSLGWQPLNAEVRSGYWGALDWIRHHVCQERQFDVPGQRQMWHWECLM